MNILGIDIPASASATLGEHLGGPHIDVKFTNGRGASIVRHFGSYGNENGLFELGVLDNKGRLDYSTPITSDVVGFLTPQGASDILTAIEKLEP